MEYLLLHAFHAKKFIVPDKFSSHAKEIKTTKRKLNNSVDVKGIDELDADDANIENDSLHNDRGKTKKGPSYLGGLVLEPKKGLYDKYILLLDFNSLYPSIIQVCYIISAESAIYWFIFSFNSSCRNSSLFVLYIMCVCTCVNRSTISASQLLKDLRRYQFPVYHQVEKPEFYPR